jgi:hypothetical protein
MRSRIMETHPRPTLDYETPQPRKRVGFLSKCNPKATLRSVVRKAITYALIAALLWLIAAYFKPAMRADWQFTFPMWVGIATLVGAVCEWQVDNDSL